MVQVVTPMHPNAASDREALSWGHSPEAEQSVLGGLLLDNKAFDVVADVVREADFFSGDHRKIFRAIFDLINAGHSVDSLTVADRLQSLKQLDDVGGMAYVGSLALNTPSAANIRRYAEIVAERSTFRQLHAAAQAVMDSCRTTRGRSARDLIDHAQSLMMQIGDGRRKANEFRSAFDVVRDVVAFVDEQHTKHKSGQGTALAGLSTGFRDLDEMTTGFHPGQLIVLAARPKMGKSAMALNIAEHVARSSGKAVPFVSMEMTLRELGLRTLSSEAKVNVQRLVSGRVYDNEWPRIPAAAQRLDKVPLFFSDIRGLTITELRALARRAAREMGGLSMLVVDYLQLMSGASEDDNRVSQITEITRGLKNLAGELNIPIMALSQLNRSLESRPNKRPVMSDLRDSGSIEQDADLILFIYRDEVYHPKSENKGMAELIIGAQRMGPTGIVPLNFRGDFTRFSGLEDSI